MSQEILSKVEKTYMKEEIPFFEIGDTVDVHTRILEGEKERIQIFSGVVIARSGSYPFGLNTVSVCSVFYFVSNGPGIEAFVYRFRDVCANKRLLAQRCGNTHQKASMPAWNKPSFG